MSAMALFWVLVGVGAAVLIAVVIATNETDYRRKRRLRRIHKRLEQIEDAKKGKMAD